MALCTITGFVYMPNGQPARSRLFRFKPANTVIAAGDGGIVIPEVVDAATNSAGFLEVTLATGSYTAFSTLYNGGIVVPDAETATLYEVFGGVGPVDPPVDVAPNFTTLPTLLGSTSLGGTITVNLGAASGSPAPVITGVLTRPGASPVAVTQGQQITVRAGDQGGSMSLTATATNAAGVDTETVSRAIPAAIPAPVFTTPLADVVLTVGDADVIVNLDDSTDNATDYSVSPTGGAVTISGSSMEVSAAAEVDQNYTVTATGPGGTATDTFGVLVGAGNISAQRVVVLTDYAGDCDDAAALAVVCKAHADGDINMLGIVATSSIATSAAGVYGQLRAYGMEDDVPVYAYQGSIGTYNNRISAPVRDAHGAPGQTRTAFPDDVTGLRTMLAAAPDASVKMIDVGAPISTSRLLDSPADAISPLTGRELVAAKVVGLWMMAGEFTSTRVEYNADRSVTSTQNVYQTWPTPVYAHGAEVGGTILTAPGAGTASGVDPVKTAFDAFDAASPTSLQVYLGRRARASWDPACVHQAIYGNQSFYNYAGANGTITVSGTGVTTWSATPSGNRFQVGKAASDAAIAAAIQAIIDDFAIVVPAQTQVMTFALNEGTGTAVTSEQGGAGTAVNTTWIAAPTRLSFNGTSSRLSLGRPRSENDLSDFIVASVARLNSVTGTPVLIGRNGTDEIGKQFFFRVNNGLLQYIPFTLKAAAIIDCGSVAANEWGLFLAYCRREAVTIRKNGVPTATDVAHPAININPEVQAAPYVMGARYSISGGNYIYRDFLNGEVAAQEIVHVATAADIPAVEQRLRAIATAKGITLP